MKSDSQANHVYSELRRRILTGQFEPNARLKEDHWAQKLGVSRMAVRETLTRLLGEGLVFAGDKGGYFVTEMTEEDVKNIREVREILEIAALKLAIERITTEQVKLMEKICKDFSNMMENGYVMGANEADIKFHETLVAASGNPRLLKLYYNAHIPLFHQKIGKTKVYLEDHELTNKEHLALLNAIKEKNLSKAEEILKGHFKRGEQAVLDLF